jgi:ferrochelatase
MSTRPNRPGVLLVNLGTPEAPHTAEVRRYLREFLSDPRVIDMNPLGRFLLLNLIILPFRPARSAEAYEKIWTPEGSPLLVYGRQLAEGVARALPEAEVVLAMRYGQPSLAAGLDRLRAAGCDHIVVVPLYPQYASSTTGSTLEAVYALAAERWNTPFIQVLPPFFDDAAFLAAFAAQGRDVLAELKPEHVLFSFHGLPERQVRKSDEVGDHCLVKADCCAVLTHANRNCYRAQCVATARGIAERLGLEASAYSVAFQSRLGRVPWIRPYTDDVLTELAGRGVRRVAVFCPAFVADCLETIEEIGLRAVESFKAAGGEQLALVPSLNASPAWIDALAALIRPRL